MVGACVDDLTFYQLPGQVGNGNLAVVAHFPPNGGMRIDVFDIPAGSIHFIETWMGQARHKSSLRPKHTGDLLDGSSGILNIRERQVTDDQTKHAIITTFRAACGTNLIA